MQYVQQGTRVLVTGAAGFIGYHLSKRLLEAGAIVTGIDNLNDYYEVSLKEERLRLLSGEANFRFVRGDIADADAVNALFEETKPQIVVNLAAQAGVRYSIENPRAYVDSNLIGFFNILEACRHFQPEHLVYASSSSVYGNRKTAPFSTDDDVSKPVSLYAATKKSNELMAWCYSHLYGFPSTGLRFFTVYGPMGRPDMAYFSFTKKIRAGETIKVFGGGNMLRDFTYVDDIVEGIMRILPSAPQPDEEGCRAKVYNIGNNKPVELMRFIRALEDAIGQEAKKEYLPMQPGDVYQTYADIGPLERDFGFRPATGIEEGLKKFAAWYNSYYGK